MVEKSSAKVLDCDELKFTGAPYSEYSGAMNINNGSGGRVLKGEGEKSSAFPSCEYRGFGKRAADGRDKRNDGRTCKIRSNLDKFKLVHSRPILITGQLIADATDKIDR